MGIGQAHLLAYVSMPDLFEVVALADTDEARRTRAARDWGIRAVTGVDELVELDLDVIDVCTPPRLHEAHCRAALAAGRHVICEKPLVADEASLDRIEADEAASSGRVMPIFQYRFAPGIARMKALVDAGLCGAVYTATAETSWLRGEDYYAAEWRGTVAGEGGGAVFGHGTHAHDLLTWIAGPLHSIQGLTATRVNPIETEDCAAAVGTFVDGGLATMSVTLGSIHEITRLRFCFEHVTAESSTDPYEPGNEPWQFDFSSDEVADSAARVWEAMPNARPGFEGQLAAFHAAIAADGPLPVTLNDARRALRLVGAWYDSAATGRVAVIGD